MFSHITWLRSVKENFGVEIRFPIIEDLSMGIAKSYGMIHPGAADASAIDPKGVINIYYGNGRLIQEFVRVVKALQFLDASTVTTLEN